MLLLVVVAGTRLEPAVPRLDSDNLISAAAADGSVPEEVSHQRGRGDLSGANTGTNGTVVRLVTHRSPSETIDGGTMDTLHMDIGQCDAGSGPPCVTGDLPLMSRGHEAIAFPSMTFHPPLPVFCYLPPLMLLRLSSSTACSSASATISCGANRIWPLSLCAHRSHPASPAFTRKPILSKQGLPAAFFSAAAAD